jgi:tetratricopeptide (TPR) repeat protein
VISVDEMLQVAIDTILAMVYSVITILFRSATNSLPDLPNDTLPPLAEEPSHLEHYLKDTGETYLTELPQIVITAIRATDLTLGLRRIPADFHVVVKTDSDEYQTSNKPVHVDQAIVEWNEPILLPCETSSKVRVSVYASFELGPMLCHGEILRTFEISVRELLDHSENSRPIIFQLGQEEVVSPCTSLFVTVEKRSSDDNDAAVRCPLAIPTSGDMDVLVVETDDGHGLLARYRRTQTSGDLDQSIKHFERALSLCPIGHPCRAAAEFNLASANLVSCQANGTYLDIPINLFQDALYLRPAGHPDRPVTQLHLAIALLYLFAKQGNQTASDAAKGLLSEVLDVCHANSHIYRAALAAFETFILYPAISSGANDLGQEQLAASMLPLSPNQLSHRVARCLQKDDPHDLDEVISLHYDALGYYNTMHARQEQVLCNLGVLLQNRFQRRGNSQDIDEAVTLLKETLALHPAGHTNWFVPMSSLANGLFIRFEYRGNNQDLNEAIALHSEALALVPVCDPNRFGSLHNLANQLSTRFEHRRNVQDLDLAIALSREALALLPTDHSNRSKSLNNLANQLFTRFQHRGNDEDLDDAMALHREALALRPDGHPDRSKSLNNLANQYSIRFEHRGNAEDLDQAIALHGEALVSHPDQIKSSNSLASQYSIRCEQ